MTETAHEAFVETVRCMLVNPRRNIGRAMDRIKKMPGHEGMEARMYLLDAAKQIAALEHRVHAEENRHVHTCSCGDTHYVREGVPQA